MKARPLLRGAVVGLALAAATGNAFAQQLALTRVRLDSVEVINALARRGYEVSGIDRVAGQEYAIIVTNVEQRAALGLDGFGISMVPRAPAAPAIAAARANYTDFDAADRGVIARLAALSARNRGVTLDTIGFSHEGRPIAAVKIGSPGDSPTRPNVVFVGTHHAREWIAAEMAMRLAFYLADSLALTAEGSVLLSTRDIWVIPVLNPDGYQYTFGNDRLWRKNRRPNADGTFGVDLNRNYPGFWGVDESGSSSLTGAETYRGPTPGSEPEVQALIAFHAAHPPAAAVSYHSYSDLVLYPYGFVSGLLAPDDRRFRRLSGTPTAPVIRDGLLESERAQYHVGPAWQLYLVNGEYTDWAYRTHGTLAFTVELTAGCCAGGRYYGFEFPDDSTAVARVVADNIPFALAVIDEAGGTDPNRAASVETAVPQVRLLAPHDADPGAAKVTTHGQTLQQTLRSDSLHRGTQYRRWHAQDLPNRAERVTIGRLGLDIDVLRVGGAERMDAGWTGWRIDSAQVLEGRYSWRATDTALVSPDFSTRDRRGVRVAFWTRYTGSLFNTGSRGVVEYSVDQGRSWQVFEFVAGQAPAWYPVSFPIPGQPESVRLRFAATSLPWWVDAVQVLADAGTSAATAALAEESISPSENPVRSGSVVLSWPVLTGAATLSIMTFRGDVVYRTEVDGSVGRFTWDLTNRNGTVVSNGAYVIVLQAGGQVMRRRLFVARR